MKLLGIIDEDFVNYKLISTTLIFPYCNMKCNKDAGRVVCHNYNLLGGPVTEISYHKLCERYLKNPISKAIVCQGLEPFDSKEDLFSFIQILREEYKCNDPVVIYTGYKEEEINFEPILKYKNIVIKFGRFIPDGVEYYDEILGVNLASSNQYAKEFNYESN